MTDPQGTSAYPTLSRTIREREQGNTLGTLGFVLSATGAFGWMTQGEPHRAADLIDALSPEQRAIVAKAARALAELAEGA